MEVERQLSPNNWLLRPVELGRCRRRGECGGVLVGSSTSLGGYGTANGGLGWCCVESTYYATGGDSGSSVKLGWVIQSSLCLDFCLLSLVLCCHHWPSGRDCTSRHDIPASMFCWWNHWQRNHWWYACLPGDGATQTGLGVNAQSISYNGFL